ncbi:MAG: nucleotidyl transferase AbiEii/AbiGii toxin family protein [bacterium]
MEHLIEHKKYYSSDVEREILLSLITNSSIESSFFLTGGTALSLFYLQHRLSDDLDFFTIDSTQNLSDIDFWIKRMWLQDCVKIKESPNFLSYLIKGTKVDFVIDLLSNKEDRPIILFENRHHLLVDTINNIVSNKFCAIVSRIEPKDFIDFYFIKKVLLPKIDIEDIYNNAKFPFSATLQ